VPPLRKLPKKSLLKTPLSQLPNQFKLLQLLLKLLSQLIPLRLQVIFLLPIKLQKKSQLLNLFSVLSPLVMLNKFNRLKAIKLHSRMTPFLEDTLKFFSPLLPKKNFFSPFTKT
jgi:hypothetical protein